MKDYNFRGKILLEKVAKYIEEYRNTKGRGDIEEILVNIDPGYDNKDMRDSMERTIVELMTVSIPRLYQNSTFTSCFAEDWWSAFSGAVNTLQTFCQIKEIEKIKWFQRLNELSLKAYISESWRIGTFLKVQQKNMYSWIFEELGTEDVFKVNNIENTLIRRNTMMQTALSCEYGKREDNAFVYYNLKKYVYEGDIVRLTRKDSKDRTKFYSFMVFYDRVDFSYKFVSYEKMENVHVCDGEKEIVSPSYYNIYDIIGTYSGVLPFSL
jgi:hypothetical protein